MKRDFKKKKIGEICNVIGGGTPSKSNADFFNGTIPWATVRDMKDDVLSDTEFKITEEALRQSASNVIPRNNVVIASRVGLGKVCLLEKDTAINQDLRAIIPKNKDELHVPFLFWWFKKSSDLIIRNGRGATVKGVNLPFIKNLEIELPAIEEQKRIVSLLDQADALRRKRRESMELLDQYVQSVFMEMFGGHEGGWKSLQETTEFIDYRGKTPEKTDSGVRLITAKNVKEGFLSEEPQEFIAEDNYIPWMRRGFPKAGDVLFTTEAPLGNAAILPHFDKAAFAQRIIILQPKENLTSEFLLFALSSQKVRDDIQKRSTGSTVKGIRSKELKKVLIPIPTLEKQRAFSSVICSVTELKTKMISQSSEIDNQFNALMQKAFDYGPLV